MRRAFALLTYSAAADGVGAQTEVPETAVPLLIAALHEVSGQVSTIAATSLADFDTNSLSAFPTLSNAVENSIGNAPAAGLKTLVTISQDDALPIAQFIEFSPVKQWSRYSWC